MSFFGGGGLAERNRKGHGEGSKNVQFLGDVLNGCSLVVGAGSAQGSSSQSQEANVGVVAS